MCNPIERCRKRTALSPPSCALASCSVPPRLRLLYPQRLQLIPSWTVDPQNCEQLSRVLHHKWQKMIIRLPGTFSRFQPVLLTTILSWLYMRVQYLQTLPKKLGIQNGNKCSRRVRKNETSTWQIRKGLSGLERKSGTGLFLRNISNLRYTEDVYILMDQSWKPKLCLVYIPKV